MSSKMTIIEGNSNDKDNVRAYMVKGEPGDDGVSPTITASRSGSTTTLNIVDGEGTKQAVINDGVSPIVEVSKEDGITDITITDFNGTHTAEIVDGIDMTGGVPTDGVIGFDGVAADIPDGYEVYADFSTLGYFKVLTTDDYNTIQSYFNVKRAKIIEFETGEYTFNTAFRLTGNTTILLNNSNLIFDIPLVTEDNQNSHGFYNFESDDEFLEYNGNGNISVIGGTITHGNFSFCHAKNIVFKNIRFELCNNDHVLEMCGINGLLVENCVFNGHCVAANTYKECIQLDNATYGNFPFFDDENNPTYDNTTNKNWIIKSNEFKNPNVEPYTLTGCIGMHSFVTNYYHENIIIENNFFNNSVNMSIQFYNVKNVLVKNNRFYCDNQTAITNQGCHLRTRNSFDKLFIENNIFDGNLRAIENGSPIVSNKNLYIRNNTFQNYINNVNNYSFINLFAIDLCYITNNIFRNFVMSCIRTNYNEIASNNKYYIIGNLFESSLQIASAGTPIKAYDGYTWLINNSFDLSSMTVPTESCIALSGDSSKVYASKNSYNSYLLEHGATLNFGSYDDNRKDIENIKHAWDGSEATVTNQGVSNAFTNYKNMVITLGSGAGTYSFDLHGWNETSQIHLDARTYNLPIGNGFAKFTINSDGTFSYDHNNTNVNLRSVALYNFN